MKILVAEDDPTMAKLMKTLLSRRGIACTVAENGRKALEAWEGDGFDFILMDVQMPVLDGFNATRLIREKERTRGGHTTIIAITAYAMQNDRERCIAAGMDDYITKPIDIAGLFSLLDKHLPPEKQPRL